MVSARAVARIIHEISGLETPPQMMENLPVIFIAGPTASGKTELAMRLAECIDVALINVDSAQVYRTMDIGSAKLDAASLKQFPHALIDIRDPAEVYDAAQFVQDAGKLIEVAHATEKIPVLVGGTQFYFSALERGVSKLPQADPEIRRKIVQQASQAGWDEMYRQLQEIDPQSCRTIQRGDRQRIQRALEIYHLTGQAPSILMAASKPQKLSGNLLKFNLFTPDRALLHRRIGQRFDLMLKAGLIEEVEALRARGDLHLDLPSMRCVGYRQVWQYLEGDLDHDTMVASSLAATRQLAKRQLTWLRHQRGQIWLSSEFENNVELILPFIK